MIMWFSPTWQQHNASQVNCLQQQKQIARSQDNLFPTLLSLLGVKTQVIDDKNDMLKQCATNPTGKA
ncbi:MAG TPA: lipid A phosphoethanolamine transferase, partial [Acinetobacter sp.]|nr:lipid A phosphoethanolamine transferase [Acinetobacter sp.]